MLRSPSLEHVSFLSFFSLSLWVSPSGHPAHHDQMAKDAPQLSQSPSPCSALCVTYLRAGQSTHRARVCVCVCSLPLPCLLRHKHPMIEAVTFLPSDNTLAHVKTVEAGGQRSLMGTRQLLRKTCACIYLHVCVLCT